MDPVPSYVYNCSVVGALRQQHGEKKPVGYLYSFRIPSTGFQASQDLDVRNPTIFEGRESIVGILEHVGWSGQAHEPLHLRGRVSRANAGALKRELDKIQSQADVLFNLYVYEWCDDPTDRRDGYIATFRTETPLKARVIEYTISKIDASDDLRNVDNLFTLTLLGVNPNADSEYDKQTIFCPKILNKHSDRWYEIGFRQYVEATFGVHPSSLKIPK